MAPSDLPVKCVLVVEDDWQTRYALQLALESAGYEVRQAANGAEALRELARGLRPDVILLDMVMPVMNGWEFRERQVSDPELADIPVIVFSAAYEVAPRAAEGLGVACVLNKPVDPGETLTAISDLFAAIESS